MKYMDKVKLINMCDEYRKEEVFVGREGLIIEAAIRDNSFLVLFPLDGVFGEDIIIPIKIEDLQLVKDGGYSEESILDDLPKNNPKWWCKVEDGYIMNLLGEKKNKIPYDYNS